VGSSTPDASGGGRALKSEHPPLARRGNGRPERFYLRLRLDVLVIADAVPRVGEGSASVAKGPKASLSGMQPGKQDHTQS